MNADDIRFMEHALALARKSVGLASPNPLVGCLVVRDGQIVGEGFHQYDLLDHAEIVALKSAGEKTRGATLYVNLEPCDHAGRTGPCTEAIIAAGLRRVVAAMEDPNPKNSGSGFERLRSAGIEVTAGACEDQARVLNEAFTCWIRTGTPFVTLKSALTLDGQLALPRQRASGNRRRTEGDINADDARSSLRRGSPRKWITSEESRSAVQRMRHASDALLTGIGTIRADDPALTDRSGLPRRRPLLRVILDSGLALSPRSRIVRTAKNDLLVFTSQRAQARRIRELEKAGVELVRAKSKGRRIDLDFVLAELGGRAILSVLLEAGPTLNGEALASGAIHKLCLFFAPKIAGENRVPFAFAPRLNLPALQDLRIRPSGPDIAVEAYLRNIYE